MQKLFYLLFDDASRDGDALRDLLCSETSRAIHGSGAKDLTIFANDGIVAAGLHTVRRSDPPIRAMAGFWLEDAADRVEAEAALSSAVQGIAGYLVVESRPMVFERKVGERVQGMKQVTCIARQPAVSVEEFHRIWHTDHRDVAIETQSTFGYVRNEIFRPLTPNAPTPWAAFVEESFPMEALTDLKAFYNHAKSEEELAGNLKKMMDSCGRFLDPEPMEVTYVSEYFLG